jgi:hypothetical protein
MWKRFPLARAMTPDGVILGATSAMSMNPEAGKR